MISQTVKCSVLATQNVTIKRVAFDNGDAVEMLARQEVNVLSRIQHPKLSFRPFVAKSLRGCQGQHLFSKNRRRLNLRNVPLSPFFLPSEPKSPSSLPCRKAPLALPLVAEVIGLSRRSSSPIFNAPSSFSPLTFFWLSLYLLG
jgi:hypothetical protein